MDQARIEKALKTASDTRAVLVKEGALEAVPALLREHFGGAPALLVADDNTYAAAGAAVRSSLTAAGIAQVEPLIFPGKPTLHADMDNVLRVEGRLLPAEVTPIVVGSGTLNDLVKLAAHRVDRAYMVVATAASMDGYTAFAAAVTHDGIKRVDPCPAPRVVVADVSVLARAPQAMSAAGYGDLLGKVISGADWMIADALQIERIDPAAWDLSQSDLRRWTSRPEALRRGEPGAFDALIEGLLVAGLAMQAARSSRPASGSEHMFSHVWEMEHHVYQGAGVSHGFQVGLGAVAAAAFAEALLRCELSHLDVEGLVARWPLPSEVERQVRASHADPAVAASAVEESLSKHLSRQALRFRLEQLQSKWPGMRRALSAQLMPAKEVARLLAAAGCPTTPEEIGLDAPRLRASYVKARQIRSRYTMLDLAAEAGVFDEILAGLFARGGYWGA